MAIAQVTAGSRGLISQINAYYNLLKGVAASGESITLIYNAAGAVILQPSSDPATGTELIQIKNNAGTVQMALSSDGKVYAANGVVGTPAYAFEAEKTTGLYRVGAGEVALSVLGVQVADFTATTATIAQPLTTSSTLTVTGTAVISGASLSIGTTPATSGLIRMPNNTTVTAKNSSASDIDILKITSGDVIQIGNTGATPITLATSGTTTVQGILAVSGATTTVGPGAAGGKVIVTGTITGGGLLASALQVGTSGPLIYSGSNAPSISAAVKGSLYLRTDGAGNTSRMYVATDTVGTWTAVNTVG